MLILAVYGKNEKDINYKITKSIIKKFDNAKVKEIFLPDDMAKPCLGCGNCYHGDEKNCYAYSRLYKIYEYMTEADLLIFSCPTFCDNMPGYYKNFFDHFAFMWMNRRPNRIMFLKKAIVISTSDKGKAKNTVKEIKKNLNWWGISNIYTYNENIKNLNDEKINKDVEIIKNKVINSKNKILLKTKIRFYKSKMMLDKNDSYNYNYWKDEGYFQGKLPWK